MITVKYHAIIFSHEHECFLVILLVNQRWAVLSVGFPIVDDCYTILSVLFWLQKHELKSQVFMLIAIEWSRVSCCI